MKKIVRGEHEIVRPAHPNTRTDRPSASLLPRALVLARSVICSTSRGIRSANVRTAAMDSSRFVQVARLVACVASSVRERVGFCAACGGAGAA